VATAVALLLGGSGAWAQTTFYSVIGSVSTSPTDLIPTLVPTVQTYDWTGYDLYVGTGAPGSFSAQAGAQMTVNALRIGNGGPGFGDGTVTIDGINPSTAVRTTVLLNGTGNRLEVGNWGSGTLTVSGGALLDATVNAANCGVNCFNVVGNAAGSTGTLTITGAGSEVKTIGGFTLGSAYVDTGFGTAGVGITNAYLNVLAGGTLRTQSTVLGSGPAGPGAQGTEQTFASAVVDGAASRWYITGTGSGGASGNLTAGLANSQATITLRNGGQLVVDATGEAGGGYNAINLGGNGGRGDLVINSGGKLSLLGGTATDRSAALNIGAYGTGSQGFATVTGAGSELSVGGHWASVNVGNSGTTGTLDVLSAGRVTSGGLSIGAKGGAGTVNVNGGFVDLNGTQGRLLVGSSGTGTLAVSGGGVVDATLNPGACVGNWCGNIVANGAGATGTLTIDGPGSEVRTLRSFQAGNLYVDQYTGTPGGTATATINITNGGKLVTGNATLGTAPGGPDALGTEKSFIDVLINGAAPNNGPKSTWTVTRNSVDNSAARMVIAGDASATASVTVSGGATLRIDNGAGTPVGANQDPAVIVGAVGKGTLVVKEGSTLDNSGIAGFINVGSLNGSDGSFQVLSGASASTTFLNLGRNAGAKGTMLIDNAALVMSGVSLYSQSTGTAGASIGRNGGDGTATVRNGGYWLISDGGQDGRSINGSPALSIGRDNNSKGLLTITGTGSKVEVVGSSVPPSATYPGDNNNPFVNVGRENSGGATSGELMVSAGGKLVIAGNALSTTTNGRTTSLNIGGRGATQATINAGINTAGKGIATVTGAGSEILMTGYDTLINVGREDGSIGVLNVFDHAQVSSISMVVGAGTTGAALSTTKAQGTVNIDNAAMILSGSRTDSSQVGAATTIGRGVNGVGILNLTNGAQLQINPTVLAGGMSVGGDQFLSGGTGTVSLSGGSSIVFGGPVTGNVLSIGRTGTGTASLDASSINVGGGNIFIGRDVGGVGSLVMNNGSTVNAGFVGVGVSAAGTGNAPAAVGGTGLLNIGNGVGLSAVHAGRVEVGAGGTVNVNAGGTLNVSSLGSTNIASALDRSVYVAQQANSTGTLVLGSLTAPSATLQADFVGVGVNAKAVRDINNELVQSNGGAGTLVLNGTVNATHFELGKDSLLTGNGDIRAGVTGPVIIGGTIAPGNSPGRIRIYCDVTMLLGSQLILEIDGNGINAPIDQLIIGDDSNFDLTQLQIIFAFVGETDPTKVDLNLNRFLRTSNTDGTDERGLQSLFNGKDWDNFIDSEAIEFQSSAFDVTSFKFDARSGQISGIQATEIPEPATYALVLLALGLMARRQRRAAAMH